MPAPSTSNSSASLPPAEAQAAASAASCGLGAPQFCDLGDLLVVGLNRQYTPQTRGGIARQWEEFVPRTGHIPRRVGSLFFGVCWSMGPGGRFDYLAGVEVPRGGAPPEGFDAVQVPARRYAVFAHHGHVSAIGATIDAIWTKWVPGCGLTVAQAPCFERYTDQFNVQTGQGGMEIWIPIGG